MAERHVLVAGGAGYLGSVLVRRLLRAGYRVRALDALIYGNGAAIAELLEEPGFSFVREDMRASSDWVGVLDEVTDVVLLAGLVGDPVCSKYPDLAKATNVEASKGFLDSLDGTAIDRLVFTSTCSNYGLRESDELATEESELAPLSSYAEQKVAIERHMLERSGAASYDSTILRVATAFGLSPRMRFDLTISEFTRTLAIGDELLVYDADTWRPYCHVSDISRAIIHVLEAPAEAVNGEVFNVGSSEGNYTKRMVVDAVLERLDGRGAVTFKEGSTDPRNYRVAFDKITDRLGFEAEYRVPDTVGNLIAAIDAGAFNDFEARRSFYTNHAIAEAAL
jgi:nucleoside-diphosphate-sugar epimerase